MELETILFNLEGRLCERDVLRLILETRNPTLMRRSH
jgi:hypothetical protein